MIHRHIRTNLGEGSATADEIGEKRLSSGRDNHGADVSPPPIFMMDSNERKIMNKSSPIKDLSFFNSDEVRKRNGSRLGNEHRKTEVIPSFHDS